MANLLGSSIEPNYRGILNLGDTINQPLSGTLQSITDGMGNASPLSLSTTIVGIGRTGVDGLVNWRRSYDGNGVAAMGVRPGFSDWYFEGNNVNFRTNSTGFFFGGGSSWETPTARLHVRGDGTNAVARFESSTGTYFASISQFAFGTIFSMNGFSITENTGSLIFVSTNTGTGAIGTLPIYDFIANSDLSTASTSNFFRINRAITPSAGSANFRPFTVRYTINATGAQTGNLTGILLDATETALNGMNHLLMDFQVGSISQLRVFRDGTTLSRSAFFVGSSVGSTAGISGVDSNNGPYTTFNTSLRIQDFRDANASGYSYFFFSSQYINLQYTSGEGGFVNIGRGFAPTSGNGIFNGLTISNTINQTGGANGITRGLLIAPVLTSASDFRGIEITLPSQSVIIGRNSGSALLQLNSTSRGFLLPRMTTTEKNAISSPAAGLMVYDTTLNKLCVFTTVWETVTSV